ncbi:unnamed protein product, partial [Rotaria sordida]
IFRRFLFVSLKYRPDQSYFCGTLQYDFEQEDIHTNEFLITSSNFIDENEKWSIVFDESNDQYTTSIDLPIEYFISS